jgi:hypothetical protein
LSDVFISYSRHDGALVARLVEALQARGKDVWVDVGGIRDAEVFPAALRMAVEQSDGFLFVISPESVASRYCEQEVAHALELNKRIVPLLYRAVPDEAAPRPWAPARARGRPPPRLGRVPRCARARRADPQVAPWVRFAGECHGVQSRRQAAGDRDLGRNHPVGHGDMASIGPPLRSAQGK